MEQVGGIVLCGGQSSRMGRAKAWLPFGDELLLPRVVRLVAEVVAPVVVVAAPGQDVPPLPPGVTVVRDARPQRGPLQGLLAGLEALPGRCAAAFLSSCDVPFLRPAFIRRLIELLGAARVAVPHVEGRHHPLAALYRLDVLTEVRRLLAADRMRPVFLFDAVPTRVVTADELAAADPGLRTLCNLNTPADYEAALRERTDFAGESP
jgi:molybdopterin-guanine dinucleotide biosynthesis protein A